MADFSTWTALHTSLKNALANRDLTVRRHRAPDGTEIDFRDLEDLRALESWVADKVAAESASQGRATRRCSVIPTGGNW